MDSPLADSQLRLRRAAQQFQLLQSQVRAWLNRRTYTISLRREAATGEDVFEIAEIEPIPDDWAVISSEIVQHFRSALDNAVHSLSVSQSGAAVKGSEFPVFADKDRFNREGRKRISGVSASCQAVIEEVQPFHQEKADEHVLWALHELSNADKHQTLALLEVLRQAENLTIGPLGGVELIRLKYAPPGPLKAGTELVRWFAKATGDGQVKVDLQLSREIVLDVARPQILKGKPLIPALEGMGNLVNGIVQELERRHSVGPSA